MTVLIASPEHLQALKAREELASAQTFSDTDALRALEAIMRDRPAVVALEKLFAASSRGTALINRIKADPALGACEIPIVSNGAAPPQPAAPPVDSAPPVPTAPAAALDQRGTRRAPRFAIVDGVEVSIDGNPATLVDLSVVGAMVVSLTILRPNQRVRFSLPDPVRSLRFSAAVAWAAFEMPRGGPRYRAGIEFFDADQDAVARFIEARKK